MGPTRTRRMGVDRARGGVTMTPREAALVALLIQRRRVIRRAVARVRRDARANVPMVESYCRFMRALGLDPTNHGGA